MKHTARETLCALVLGFAAPDIAAEPPPTTVSNPEMLRIFDQDQADRKGPAKVDIVAADERRRQETRKLLEQGSLRTGEDFRAAAFVFQHGDKPDDYLLAHTLAMIAVARGSAQSLWISTATLDRYLQSIGQKQVFGTQYRREPQAESTWTQEPYNRALVSDALRQDLGAKTASEQDSQLTKLNARKR